VNKKESLNEYSDTQSDTSELQQILCGQKRQPGEQASAKIITQAILISQA